MTDALFLWSGWLSAQFKSLRFKYWALAEHSQIGPPVIKRNRGGQNPAFNFNEFTINIGDFAISMAVLMAGKLMWKILMADALISSSSPSASGGKGLR